MPQFHYQALTAAGETVRGQMEALRADDVIARLQEQGLLPIEARLGDAAALGFSGWQRSPFPAAQQQSFFAQLATLLGAGQPLDRALATLLEQPESPAAQAILGRVREAVRGGQPLSAALEQEHGVFPRLVVQMVRAGEVGGQLQPALLRLAEQLERAAAVRAQVISALIYPAILVLMVGVVLVVLLGVVVPQFNDLLSSMDVTLPWYSTAVLQTGQFLHDAGPWLIAVVVLAGLIGWQQLRQPERRVAIDAWWVRQPRLGQVRVRSETARLARLLGTLLSSGVPLLSALAVAAQGMGSATLAAAVIVASDEVKEGQGLALALSRAKLFPKLAVQMVQVGEESGDLPGMLLKVAEVFELETRRALERVLAALVPVLTVGMAIVVAIVVLAVLVPLYDLTANMGA